MSAARPRSPCYRRLQFGELPRVAHRLNRVVASRSIAPSGSHAGLFYFDRPCSEALACFRASLVLRTAIRVEATAVPIENAGKCMHCVAVAVSGRSAGHRRSDSPDRHGPDRRRIICDNKRMQWTG